MMLALAYDLSLRSRHELGYVASLRLYGVNVVVILLDKVTNEPMVCEETIEVDGNRVKVPVLKLPSAKAFTYHNFLTKLLTDFHVNSIITLPRKPYLLAYKVSSKLGVALIARFWSIRALKLVDNLRSGAYGDLLLFIPSLTANLVEGLLSNGIMVIDDVMYKALKGLGVNRIRALIKVYPPAGFLPKGRFDEDVIEKTRYAEPYVVAMTVLSKTGAYLKFEAKPHALLFYHLAKRIPSINFLVGGSTKEEFISTFPSLRNKMPKNLIFVGRGFTDDTLKLLYKHSVAAITFINNRSISNRLLEAIALNTAVVTNPLALLLHPELSDSVMVARNIDDYQRAIKYLAKNDDKREELREKLKKTYSRYFSPKLNSVLTLKLANLAWHAN